MSRKDSACFSRLATEFESGRIPQVGIRMNAEAPRWQLSGRGYEFCNCESGGGAHISGMPNSKDGSCRALMGLHILGGYCDRVNLSDVKCAAVISWPLAAHKGGGTGVLVVDSSATDSQVGSLSQIFQGKLGGDPWGKLGSTFEMIRLVKARIVIEGEGTRSAFRIEGVGEGRGDTFRNPLTGKPHRAIVDLPTGTLWKRGECGEGSFRANIAGLSLAFSRTNWVYYQFDWSNSAPAIA